MNKVDLYIDGTLSDAFTDEAIEINLTTQNIQDIGAVFGDYSRGFNLPATKVNNGIFKHYYNVDISGGFDANVRVDAFIEVNTILFREGKIELEGVQFKNGEPYAYSVTFYGKTASLKDEFGEDQLTDLDLSIGDHSYNDLNIKNGLDGYVGGTGDNIIYPLISSSYDWFYNSSGSSHEANNIHYHSGHNEHGVFYYDLKPAIKLKAILDAIETDYGVTFNSDLFDSTDFAKLFMWCHRKEGYMFKDQRDSYPSQYINFITGTNFNLLKDYYQATFVVNSYGGLTIEYNLNFVSGNECELYVIRERTAAKAKDFGGEGIMKIATIPITGNTTASYFQDDVVSTDKLYFAFAPKPNWGGGALEVEINVEGLTPATTPVSLFDAQTSGTLQTFTTEVVIADQMPEQKIIDFLRGLIKMFNLVVIYEGNDTYKIDPLDDWYSEGNTLDITRYIDTTEFNTKRPDLYRRIEFNYQETGAIVGETFRNTSGGGVGYGDLRADFSFDGGEFKTENEFEHFLFERLVDLDDSIQTEFAVGKAIDKDSKPYIGAPYVFYAPTLTPTLTKTVAYINTADTEEEIEQFWLVSNCNDLSGEDITKTINYGTEIDPYTGTNQTGGLYQSYWQDYITDLYSTARRVYSYSAIFPLDVILKLQTNDKLTITDRNYIINSVTLNLTNGQTTLELLNDV
jgi:hypothetical protein